MRDKRSRSIDRWSVREDRSRSRDRSVRDDRSRSIDRWSVRENRSRSIDRWSVRDNRSLSRDRSVGEERSRSIDRWSVRENRSRSIDRWSVRADRSLSRDRGSVPDDQKSVSHNSQERPVEENGSHKLDHDYCLRDEKESRQSDRVQEDNDKNTSPPRPQTPPTPEAGASFVHEESNLSNLQGNGEENYDEIMQRDVVSVPDSALNPCPEAQPFNDEVTLPISPQ